MPTKTIVPAYFYPAGNTYWDDLTNLAASLAANTVTAILNQSNGHFTVADPNYVTAANNFVAVGGKLVGYVYSSYGARPIADVKADIANYIAQFPYVTGFFIDEMSNLQSNVAYYQELHDYIKLLSPSYTIIGNPGANTLETYMPTADILVTFEGSGATYQSYTPATWMADYSADHFSHLVYGVASAAGVLAVQQHALATGGGNLYVTNDVLTLNPWDTLSSYYPTSPILGSASNDIISGTQGNDVINGQAGNDTLKGSFGNDTLIGGLGNDVLDGGLGADRLAGGLGDDMYILDFSVRYRGFMSMFNNSASDKIVEFANEGVDTLVLRGNASYHFGGKGHSQNSNTVSLVGTEMENIDASNTIGRNVNLIGNDYNNTLIGNSVSNRIYGGLGNDTLIGGVGNDGLVGGLGVNKAKFFGVQADYQISVNTQGLFTITDTNMVNGDEGTDILTQIQYLEFSDGILSVSAIQPSNLPMGTSFLLNTDSVNYQYDPSTIGLADGGFISAWMTVDAVTFVRSVHGQLFSPSNSKVGAEFLIAATGMAPSVAQLSNGDLIVTTQTLNSGIELRHFNHLGNQIGVVVQVNTYGAVLTNPYGGGTQEAPKITALANGGYVVVWQSDDSVHSWATTYGADNNGYGVYGQRFDALDNKVGGEFKVNTYVNSTQSAPSIASLNDGSFVVVWQSIGQDVSTGPVGTYGIYAQRFGSDGAKLGSEFGVNTTTNMEQKNPSITHLSDDSLMVVWESNAINSGDVYGQHLATDGSLIGSEFKISSSDNSISSSAPTTTALSDGNYVVTWLSTNNFGQIVAKGQLFLVDGTKISTEFVINENYPNRQSAVALEDGGFVVTWGTPSTAQDIYAQHYGTNSFYQLTGTDTNNYLSLNSTTRDFKLNGLGGDDVLKGASGNDLLTGGLGRDSLTGGLGADTFDFNLIGETVIGANCDVITDFNHAELDKIDLSNIDANIIIANDQAFVFIGNNVAFSAAGQLRYDTALHTIFGEVDGVGGADFQIELTGVASLSASDFNL